MKIAVGSKNKTKIGAVANVLASETNEIVAVDVPSGVSLQPFSDEETLLGAKNRAHRALFETNSDIGIGLEGGVMETKEGMLLCNWGALKLKDGTEFIASGARILLPEDVARGLRNGFELSEVMEEYTAKHDVRSKEGAIGVFTNNLVQREEMFTHIVKLLVGQYLFASQKVSEGGK
ncbi:DUF84 family protein [Calidifontibacillus erzurumensis]|uniref:inosine/xanthosine triphosphatase n=1 Tax=Calidifontibacillus erzurumensis TaxID=2741433 RepID=A0A8J8GCB7_9BACI|nr:DUF84 family protein [Calidifontibacillus erzurumensis]NSL51330.1 DUF84 family protein [Calidifontibacillus erzurumensis]